MLRKIHAKRDAKGRVVVRLYGRDFDLTNAVIDGRAEMHAFGDDYEVCVEGELRQSRKQRKPKNAESVEQQILNNSDEAVENDGGEDGKDNDEE